LTKEQLPQCTCFACARGLKFKARFGLTQHCKQFATTLTSMQIELMLPWQVAISDTPHAATNSLHASASVPV